MSIDITKITSETESSLAQVRRMEKDFISTESLLKAEGDEIRKSLAEHSYLQAALEGIYQGRLGNQGTLMMTMREFDRLGVTYDTNSMESTHNIEDMHQVALEGLGKTIDNIKDRFRNWSSRRATAGESARGNIVGSAERIIGEIDKVLESLAAVDQNGRATVDVSAFRDTLIESEAQYTRDPAKFLREGCLSAERWIGEVRRRMGSIVKRATSLYGTMDFSSFDAMKKTYIAPSSAFDSMFIHKLPRDVGFLPHAEITLEDKDYQAALKMWRSGAIEERSIYAAAPLIITQYAPDTDRLPSKHQAEVKVADVIRALKDIRKVLTTLTVPYMRAFNTEYTAVDTLGGMYYAVELQRQVRSEKHINQTGKPFQPGTLQFAFAPVLWYNSVAAQALYIPLYSGSAAVQLGRRVATAVKHG